MNSKSQFNETVIANALLAIFERLDALEKATNILAGQYVGKTPLPCEGAVETQPQPQDSESVLKERLARLTLKRHAVLTATLGGQSYQQMAKAMYCDVTTVKLHLRGALDTLGIPSRSVLLAAKATLLDSITNKEYERRFGLRKDWWTHQNPTLMAVLQQTKPAKNQHTN